MGARDSAVNPGPFFMAGGPIGVLMLHGFTGSPLEMRPVGEYLSERGLTISSPLLPGHGRGVDCLNQCRWSDWTDHAERSLAEIRAGCDSIFVTGLSMGALITIYLAAHHRIDGIVLYSPPFKVSNPLIYLTPALKLLVPAVPLPPGSDLAHPSLSDRTAIQGAFPTTAAHELLKLIRRTQDLLSSATCPALVVHSTGDHVIRSSSAKSTLDRIGSQDKAMVTLHGSGHVITADVEWDVVAGKTFAFIQSRALAGD